MALHPRKGSGFFRVTNWEKYQEYHQRGREGVPAWIKLSTAFFDDAGVAEIPESQRLCLVAVLVMAARCRNRIPYDAAFIATRCGLHRKPDLDLFAAQGFIEKCDVVIAQADDGLRRPRGEESRGEERRGELASKRGDAREPADDSGPRTPATPAEARDLALSVLGAPSAAPPPDPTAYVHGGVAYRAGDTLPDGRRVESVEGGVPVLLRHVVPSEAEGLRAMIRGELDALNRTEGIPPDQGLAWASLIADSGATIAALESCTALPWMRTTLAKLEGRRKARLVGSPGGRREPTAAEQTIAATNAVIARYHAQRGGA